VYLVRRTERTGTDGRGHPKRGFAPGLKRAESFQRRADSPIWIVDYVLAEDGTGLVMGVPAHDPADFFLPARRCCPSKRVRALRCQRRGLRRRRWDAAVRLVPPAL